MIIINYRLDNVMHLNLLVTFLVCLASCVSGKVLTNSFLVEFHQDTDRLLADQIAYRNGFLNRGPVSEFFSFRSILFTGISQIMQFKNPFHKNESERMSQKTSKNYIYS